MDLDSYLLGAPDLVVQVLSPPNTRAEMREREAFCLANGTVEFWIVDSTRRQVTVSHKDGSTQLYHSGDEIPLTLLNVDPIPVDSIFAHLP